MSSQRWREYHNGKDVPDFREVHPIFQRALIDQLGQLISKLKLSPEKPIDLIDVGGGRGGLMLRALEKLTSSGRINVARVGAIDIDPIAMEIYERNMRLDFPNVAVRTRAGDLRDPKVLAELQGNIGGSERDTLVVSNYVLSYLNQSEGVNVMQSLERGMSTIDKSRQVASLVTFNGGMGTQDLTNLPFVAGTLVAMARMGAHAPAAMRQMSALGVARKEANPPSIDTHLQDVQTVFAGSGNWVVESEQGALTSASTASYITRTP